VLYNFGLGLRNSTLPMEQGMLLHDLTVAVNGVPVIRCSWFCAPSQPLPVASEPEPSTVGSATLILEPPRRPGSEYTFNVTICYTENVNGTARRTCLNDTLRVPLPFGWRLVYNVLDTCEQLQQLWEVVPANETGYMVVVWDTVEPSVSLRDYCIAAAAGGCESVGLRVYQDGSMIASRTGRGEAKWCPAEPGVYTVVAVDGFNNTATGTFTITWSAGPPPALKRALQGLAGAAIALMVGLYIVLGGGWSLRGV